MESFETALTENILNIKKFWEILKHQKRQFFQKLYEKPKSLSKFLGSKILNLDDYAGPKLHFMIFKDDEYEWRSSNYRFRHAKIFRCA